MKPQKIKLLKDGSALEVQFPDLPPYTLSAEFLRVHSPSAEVKGHGPGQEVLQWGKQHVTIERVVKCGNYALQLFYSDGHDTGIYSWNYLAELGAHHEQYWQEYLTRLEQAGKPRDPDVQVVKLL